MITGRRESKKRELCEVRVDCQVWKAFDRGNIVVRTVADRDWELGRQHFVVEGVAEDDLAQLVGLSWSGRAAEWNSCRIVTLWNGFIEIGMEGGVHDENESE